MTRKKIATIPSEEYKFGTYCAIDMRPCKARTRLGKFLDSLPRLGPTPEDCRVKVVITGYFDGVLTGFDGVGQEFSVHVEKVVVK